MRLKIKVVIDMKNSNALVSMALVSQNANNPYLVFCEYFKYCIFNYSSKYMTITEARDAVGNEFGLRVPYNIALKCLSLIEEDGFISLINHKIKRIGEFDTDAFVRERNSYREIENTLIKELIDYVYQYGRNWTFEYARDQFIKVLDKKGLAYDIFINGFSVTCDAISKQEIDALLPDEDAKETENPEKQPLYSDDFFVGRFIQKILSTDSCQRDYLQRICEGLMVCVGAYQLPNSGMTVTAPQIKNTEFFFDTRLLLRFIGCAGNAAVEAAKELVILIQERGGKIYYYPQVLEEMERAFDEAIYNLSQGFPPYDEEMRIFAANVGNSTTILRSKKADLTEELSKAHIYLRKHEQFSDKDNIRFGFSLEDLKQYMAANLSWDIRTIENDALSLWETHMRRQGDYSEYCGTNAQLPVFVTTNSRLLGIAIEYRKSRPKCSEINGWQRNRLPVITDIRLTCRLWIPSEHCERLSLLHLTANAVAAQRPTQKYLNTVRKLALELREYVPEYSGIPLTAFFDDNVTDALLEHTSGSEEKLNIGTFASTLSELSEWKARDQEEITKRIEEERNSISSQLDAQTKSIIEDAVENNKNKLGLIRAILLMILGWPIMVTLVFAGVSSVISAIIGNWGWVWITVIPMALCGIECFSSSRFIRKQLLLFAIPKLEKSYNKHIINRLRKIELEYKDTIITQVKEQTNLWIKCNKAISE